MSNFLQDMGVLKNHPQGTIADVNIRLQQNPEPQLPARPDPGRPNLEVGGHTANTENKNFGTDPVSGLPIA